MYPFQNQLKPINQNHNGLDNFIRTNQNLKERGKIKMIVEKLKRIKYSVRVFSCIFERLVADRRTFVCCSLPENRALAV